MQKTYILGPRAAERMKAQWRKPFIPLGVYGGIAAVGFLFLAVLLFPSGWKMVAIEAAVLLSLILVILAVSWTARHLIERSIDRRVVGFRLIVDSEGFIRQQAGLPDVRVAFSEISALEEDAEHGLRIRTSDSFRQTFVPIDLLGYDELKTHLSQWKQPVRRSWRLLGFLTGTVGAGCVIAWEIIRSSHDLRIIVAVATLLTTYMLWSLYKTWRSREIGRSTKLLVVGLDIAALVALFRLVAPHLT